MKNLFYVAAGLLVLIWAYVLINYQTQDAVHILLVLAFFCVLVGIYNTKKRLA